MNATQLTEVVSKVFTNRDHEPNEKKTKNEKEGIVAGCSTGKARPDRTLSPTAKGGTQ